MLFCLFCSVWVFCKNDGLRQIAKIQCWWAKKTTTFWSFFLSFFRFYNASAGKKCYFCTFHWYIGKHLYLDKNFKAYQKKCIFGWNYKITMLVRKKETTSQFLFNDVPILTKNGQILIHKRFLLYDMEIMVFSLCQIKIEKLHFFVVLAL